MFLLEIFDRLFGRRDQIVGHGIGQADDFGFEFFETRRNVPSFASEFLDDPVHGGSALSRISVAHRDDRVLQAVGQRNSPHCNFRFLSKKKLKLNFNLIKTIWKTLQFYIYKEGRGINNVNMFLA